MCLFVSLHLCLTESFYEGESGVGKSNFLNTLNTAWNADAHKWERFQEGQTTIFGSCRFDGPQLLQRQRGQALLRVFDVTGFLSPTELEENIDRAVALYSGEIKPGKWLLPKTKPLFVQMEDTSFTGADLIVVVAQMQLAGGQVNAAGLDRAVHLSIELKKKGTEGGGPVDQTMLTVCSGPIVPGCHTCWPGRAVRIYPRKVRRVSTRLHRELPAQCRARRPY